MKEFEHSQYNAFKIPVIFGFLYIRTLTVQDNKYDFALVSRKDCRRPGRRFISRGLDKEGNASNFVETEHIITLYDQNSIQVSAYT